MKKVLTIVLAMLCLASCEKSTQKNDLAELKLNGKVKSIREIPYKAVEKFGEVAKGDALDIIGENLQITFNEKGNKLEENWFNPDGRLFSKYTYKYDDKGNKLEENLLNSDVNLDDKYTYKYTYDQQGNWIQRIAYKVKNGVEKPSQIVERTIEYY